MIRVTHFLRRPGVGTYSLERLYEDVRSKLPDHIDVRVCTNRFLSKKILGRFLDSVRAVRYQSDVNHVTGDVHYLTYFLRRRRTILTILDCVSLQRYHGFRFWLMWFFWYWLPEKRCVAIPVISDATRQQFLSYVRCDPSKVRVIHCNVSDEFSPYPAVFNRERPRILHVGTTVNKNLHGHAAALTTIRCVLIVIGELVDEQRQVLNTYGIEYENHVGLSRSGLVEQYRRCDLLLFASTYEGFGLPIVEAQAVGRPVVTSQLWSMPEVAGLAACFVDPFDVGSIRAGVLRVLEQADYRESLVQGGYENVKRFRTDVIARQYADLYQEVYERAQTNHMTSAWKARLTGFWSWRRQ